MKIGVICSTAGGAFRSSFQIIKELHVDVEFVIITDRECEIENFCKSENIQIERIIESDNEKFSIKACNYLKNNKVDSILLIFSRLVTSDLFNSIPTFNIHPSLLPAFKGMNSVSKAFNAKVKYLGATLHVVDEGIDTGMCIAQSIHPIPQNFNLSALNKISYIQKVGLILIFIDLLKSNSLYFDSSNQVHFKKSTTTSFLYNPDFISEKFKIKFNIFYKKNYPSA